MLSKTAIPAGDSRPIPSERKAFHAKRIITEHKERPEHLRVLMNMARRENRWHHIDWDMVWKHLERIPAK